MGAIQNPYRGATLVVGSQCAGSVRCYAAMCAAAQVAVDVDETKLPLRHSHHRYRILGPNGVQQLTVPIAGSTNAMGVKMRDVLIAEHGRWREMHWGALYSAYGQSPYFDYIAPDLERIVMGGQRYLLDFNQQLNALLCDFMALPLRVEACGNASELIAGGATDMRRRLGGKRRDHEPMADVPYYQLWAQRYGFQPDLSILDLCMNEGREGLLLLGRMTGEQLCP